MRLLLNLLGGIEARFGDGAPMVFARKKAQALLAYLALPDNPIVIGNRARPHVVTKLGE
jgi:hypothetical protein